MTSRARFVWLALAGLYLLFVGLTAWSLPFISNVGTLMQPAPNITSAPPVPTYHIQTESDNNLVTESGDKLRTETP